MTARLLARVHNSVWNEIILILLALASVTLLVIEFSIQAADIAWLYGVDYIVAFIFLADFAVGLYVNTDKKAYLRSNWYLLVAAVPLPPDVFQAFRSLRLLRVLRVIQVIARIKRLTVLAAAVSENGARYVYLVTITTVVIFTGAVALFTVEADVNPGLTTFFDAVWWSTVTTTTVGYGDIYPVTWEGRIVGMGLMLFGIGVIGTVAGMVGSKVLHPNAGNKT